MESFVDSIPLADDLTRGLVLSILSELKICLRQRKLPSLRVRCILTLEGAVAYAEACIDRPLNIDGEFNHRYARNITGSLQGLYDNYPYNHYIDAWKEFGLTESDACMFARRDGLFDIFDHPDRVNNHILACHNPELALKLMKMGKLDDSDMREVIVGAVQGHADLATICQLHDHYVNTATITDPFDASKVKECQRANAITIQRDIFEGILRGGNFALLEILLTNSPFEFELDIANVDHNYSSFDMPESSLEYLSRTLIGGREQLMKYITPYFEDKSPAIIRWVLKYGTWDSKNISSIFYVPAITYAFVERYGLDKLYDKIFEDLYDNVFNIIKHQELINYIVRHLGFNRWYNLVDAALTAYNLHVFRTYGSRLISEKQRDLVVFDHIILPAFERVAAEHKLTLRSLSIFM